MDDLAGILVEHFASAEFWLNGALLIALARALWVVVGKVTEAAIFRVSLRTRTERVRLSAWADYPAEIKGVGCLFIRHGNDLYLRHLASDQERHHGRLHNRTRPAKVTHEPDGSLGVEFRLRVHQRLGTQFKLFVDVAGDTAPVMAYLRRHENIHGISVAGNNAGGKGSRIYFLLKNYATVTTIEGFENNMIWPA